MEVPGDPCFHGSPMEVNPALLDRVVELIRHAGVRERKLGSLLHSGQHQGDLRLVPLRPVADMPGLHDSAVGASSTFRPVASPLKTEDLPPAFRLITALSLESFVRCHIHAITAFNAVSRETPQPWPNMTAAWRAVIRGLGEHSCRKSLAGGSARPISAFCSRTTGTRPRDLRNRATRPPITGGQPRWCSSGK